jgi:hypothetical protein
MNPTPDQTFRVSRPTEQMLQREGEIAQIFIEAQNDLQKLCGDGREWSIVKTKLEEAFYFARQALPSGIKTQAA